MRKSVLDTNVLLRFFVGDHPAHLVLAKDIFQGAQKGRCSLVILPIIVAETVFVLDSFYKKSPHEIADVFEVFLSQRWLDVLERDILLSAIDRYRLGEHFVDCYLAAWAQYEDTDPVTFDTKLKKRLNK